MDYSLFLNLAPMSLGQYLEYIARCVLVMPCAMRKGAKGSIGLTNSSPWRHSRNVVCQLGLPFCHRPQLMLGLWHLVRNVFTEKYTRWHPYWTNERTECRLLSLIGLQSLPDNRSILSNKIINDLDKRNCNVAIENFVKKARWVWSFFFIDYMYINLLKKKISI